MPRARARLTIELVPTTCWWSNVRSEVTPKTWDTLRRGCYSRADYRCEICKGHGPKWPVECHEIWDYDDEHKVQTLTGLIALCPKCHEVKHIGRAQATSHGERAIKHLMKVNKWTRAEAHNYIQDCYATWNERSQHEWLLDIRWLEERLPNAERRSGDRSP